jgi:ABC-type bacteriocin/lantibiotic exporter with double-glycine peptidase domain
VTGRRSPRGGEFRSSRLGWRWSRGWREEQLAGYIGSSLKVVTLGAAGAQIVGLINKLATVAILWFGAQAVITGKLTIGEFVAFNMLAGQISQPVLRLAQLWQDFQQFRLSIERLGDDQGCGLGAWQADFRTGAPSV